MDSFLKNTNYKTIMKAEVKHWYVWSTFLPYVKLVYIPETPQTEMMRKLQLLSLQTVLFGLQNMLGRQNHVEVLVREGLLDYVTCMPLYVPESLKPQAREVVRMLGSSGDVEMHPPKLVSLLKAQLAKTHTGLEKIDPTPICQRNSVPTLAFLTLTFYCVHCRICSTYKVFGTRSGV